MSQHSPDAQLALGKSLHVVVLQHVFVQSCVIEEYIKIYMKLVFEMIFDNRKYQQTYWTGERTDNKKM